MQWVILGLLGLALWWLWDIRRVLKLRARPVRIPKETTATQLKRADFPGAQPPDRYVVVRWPEGLFLYQGCLGSLAKKTFEHTHPAVGQEVELWELATCRGHKGA